MCFIQFSMKVIGINNFQVHYIPYNCINNCSLTECIIQYQRVVLFLAAHRRFNTLLRAMVRCGIKLTCHYDIIMVSIDTDDMLLLLCKRDLHSEILQHKTVNEWLFRPIISKLYPRNTRLNFAISYILHWASVLVI